MAAPPQRLKEAPVGIEPTNSRFAVCRLTTWPRRRERKLSPPPCPVQAQVLQRRSTWLFVDQAPSAAPVSSSGSFPGAVWKLL